MNNKLLLFKRIIIGIGFAIYFSFWIIGLISQRGLLDVIPKTKNSFFILMVIAGAVGGAGYYFINPIPVLRGWKKFRNPVLAILFYVLIVGIAGLLGYYTILK